MTEGPLVAILQALPAGTKVADQYNTYDLQTFFRFVQQQYPPDCSGVVEPIRGEGHGRIVLSFSASFIGVPAELRYWTPADTHYQAIMAVTYE